MTDRSTVFSRLKVRSPPVLSMCPEQVRAKIAYHRSYLDVDEAGDPMPIGVDERQNDAETLEVTAQGAPIIDFFDGDTDFEGVGARRQ